MGPNLYVTPPGSFTHFHQDGHGTVDSGHQCLRGNNEVVMLRRLDEANKRRALKILCGSCLSYDALYGKPHDAGEKPLWPTEKQIAELRKLNYCPSVFTLQPGDFVHINKGRLHAFRKKRPADPTCPEEFCVSVAWDWLYQGSSLAGAAAEVREPLLCAEKNKGKQVPSLGHVETAMTHAVLAANAALRANEGPQVSQHMQTSRETSLPGFPASDAENELGAPRDTSVMAKGLLRSLGPAMQNLFKMQLGSLEVPPMQAPGCTHEFLVSPEPVVGLSAYFFLYCSMCGGLRWTAATEITSAVKSLSRHPKDHASYLGSAVASETLYSPVRW